MIGGQGRPCRAWGFPEDFPVLTLARQPEPNPLASYSVAKSILQLVIAGVLSSPAFAQAAAPSSEDLELAFNGHCRECHSFEKDDNRIGPTLYGVVGRKAGTVASFAYSDSIKGSEITWDEGDTRQVDYGPPMP